MDARALSTIDLFPTSDEDSSGSCLHISVYLSMDKWLQMVVLHHGERERERGAWHIDILHCTSCCGSNQ